MKLSEALEHCITSGAYSYEQSSYMCHALFDCGLSEHRDAVMEKVRSIAPGYKNATMASALSDAGLTEFQDEYWPHPKITFKLTLQFYIWWIVQLRKEGK